MISSWLCVWRNSANSPPYLGGTLTDVEPLRSEEGDVRLVEEPESATELSRTAKMQGFFCEHLLATRPPTVD